MLTLDHLVVVAPDLAEGVAHVRDCLGLDMPDLDHDAKIDVEERDPRCDFAAVLDGRPATRGEVVEVNPGAFATTRTFALATDTTADSEGSGRGVPTTCVRMMAAW